MDVCINTNTAEFQTLLKLSGLPAFYLTAICRTYLDNYDRFPYLDEIPGADSTKFLVDLLHIKNNSASIKSILNFTGTTSLEDALISLNNTFRDLEIELIPLNKDAILNVSKKPISEPIISGTLELFSELDSSILFENIIYKLKSLYGIQLNEIDNESLQNSELANIPGVANAKAFVYNNQIYINTDFADADAPIHEMMHILMGSLRSSNPDLYFDIVSKVSQFSNFKDYIDKYPNRTLSDVAEEAFVEEFSKLATLGNSELKNLTKKEKYELFYNAKRVLDTIIMGESSVKNYSDTHIFNESLVQLCRELNSSLISGEYKGTISLHNGEVHRLLANKKLELFEKHQLEEQCYG